MKKILEWLQKNKVVIILIAALIFIFFLTILLLSNNYVKPIKEERNQIKKEKQELLKTISSLTDSINYYQLLSQKAIDYDTILIEKIKKEKIKTNVQISNIPNLSSDSNQLLFSQTGFVKDSSE
jgi:hypothetical protein